MLKRLTYREILTHFFFVSLFLVIPTLAFVRPPGEDSFALTRIFIQDTVANFVLLCFFYLNYYVLLPKFFFSRSYILYAVFVCLFLSLALTIPYLAGRNIHDAGRFVHDPGMGRPPLPPPGEGPAFGPPRRQPTIVSFVFDEFRRHLSLFFSAIFFSFLLRTREHLSQLKEEKLQAELLSLKAQINPHFLFNTLNTIYALSVKKDARAPEAIINLSGLMRYVIRDANDYKIALQKEVNYITNYIELQKARLGNTVSVVFEVSGNVSDKQIAPLILITYIENAFKYGVNPDVEDCKVEIKIQVRGNTLSMFVFNKKVPLVNNIESTGIGITNTAGRLTLLYPGKHIIDIKENKENYTVALTLELYD